MSLKQTRALLAISAVAFSVLASPAFAKTSHAHRTHSLGRSHHASAAHRHVASHRLAGHRYASQGRRYRIVPSDAETASTASPSLFSGFSGSTAVVDEARRYIGGNPTGRSSLWCGAFMDMVLKRTGHPGGGNLAAAYAHYGPRVSGPQVGAIAVMGRRGGGHVGVVSGVDPAGNPIIISGNHGHRVAESVYPRGRIYAYVMPSA
jgi:uncharacterized protein (TIGR02594 family)